MIGDKPNWTDRLKGVNINMMIEFAGRINLLEDKIKDLKSKENTLIADIEGLKQRLANLEYHDQVMNASGYELEDEEEIERGAQHILTDIENYGGSK